MLLVRYQRQISTLMFCAHMSLVPWNVNLYPWTSCWGWFFDIFALRFEERKDTPNSKGSFGFSSSLILVQFALLWFYCSLISLLKLFTFFLYRNIVKHSLSSVSDWGSLKIFWILNLHLLMRFDSKVWSGLPRFLYLSKVPSHSHLFHWKENFNINQHQQIFRNIWNRQI